MTERTMHLNAFLMNVGHHEAAWRLPQSDPAANEDIRHYIELARIAERGTFDSVFLADSPALRTDVGQRPATQLEPTVVLAALAVATERIGLVATASTSYNEPYNLARRFASLDHISGGRAGWNIVTNATAEAAHNFGYDELPSHSERYRRAEEFVEVSQRLWDSWEDSAELGEKSGAWADTDRVHEIDHRGEHFAVRGPLNVTRPPQGHPLLVQAGSSEDGKNLAAAHAEAVFTAQQTLDEGKAFYADLKDRALRLGRDPETIKILPGIVPVIGDTEQEAARREVELAEHVVHGYALQRLSDTLGVLLTDSDLDRPLPKDLPGEDGIETAKSRYTLIVDMARRDNLTVRQIIHRLSGGRGHRTIAGTPEQIAETLQHWFTSGAADGFNVMPAVLPEGLESFVDHVVPLLRERGLFRESYSGLTLREHYGLSRPANRFTRDRRAAGTSGS
ncbi:LLM class flavin-dependent oxidoreductase [Saccharopolyspora sp. HNM0983]|uniref:LLM class flavin-dependent oxidoreductase n=1 Tax=Saccharopolyspora montiporae TaxID=2781240 RepID=A0A929B923_9PSEU|nr:LLM class flavin-dependent oxidoreductase [Saccharopolyspora sp. HNM0983]MBE9375524.1 LLM class flavin-dependent oxidoreductase [Saccharopolyspora sp. HNM0983]